MTPESFRALPATRELVDVLLDLTLVSHVRGTNYDPMTSGSSTGRSPFPPGGIDRQGDREEEYRQKSADFFARRLDGLAARVTGLSDNRVETVLAEILDAAKTTLRDWRRTPRVEGQDPEHGTLAWKIQIANDDRSSRSAASFFGCSHVTVLRYRAQYAGLAE